MGADSGYKPAGIDRKYAFLLARLFDRACAIVAGAGARSQTAVYCRAALRRAPIKRSFALLQRETGSWRLACTLYGMELLAVVTVIPASLGIALVLQIATLKGILWLLASRV